MTFGECLLATADVPELFEEFCRFEGYVPPRSEIARMIDEASGRAQDITARYAAFVFDVVYLPLVREVEA